MSKQFTSKIELDVRDSVPDGHRTWPPGRLPWHQLKYPYHCCLLKKLAVLHAQCVITDEEFAAMKKKLLEL